MEVLSYLSLGSDLGDRESALRAGLQWLGAARGVELEKVSSVYETSPVGVERAGAFLNAAARLRTELGAEDLLKVCRAAEQAAGRSPGGERWGPRALDVDIIFHGETKLSLPGLTVPHPRFAERLFVLEPLLELDPGLAGPDGTPLARLLEAGRAENRFAGQAVRKLYFIIENRFFTC